MTIFVCATFITIVAAYMVYRLGRSHPIEPTFRQPLVDSQSVPSSELVQEIRKVRQDLVDQHDLLESNLRHLESLYGPDISDAEEARVCAEVVCTLRQACDRVVDAYDMMRQVDDRLLQHEHGVPGIESRAALDTCLSERFALQSRYGNHFSLALLSLDVDERRAGKVQEIGEILSQFVRETDRIFQYSDRELLVALPETDLEGCRLFGRRLLGAASEELDFVLRMGLAVAALEDNARSLLNRADAALFQASCGEDQPVFLHDGERIQPIDAAQVCGGSVIAGL